MELLLSGGMRYECTHNSFSFVTSAIRREIVTRTRYLGNGRYSVSQHEREGVGRGYAPELDVDALVALVLFLHVLEEKVERLCCAHFPWRCELLG